MALCARALRRFAKLYPKLRSVYPVSCLHVQTKQLAKESPPGYEYIFLPEKDLPAPLPKGPLTPEKRAELAAKYNLRPEDYVPMPGMGDYPTMPGEGAYDRDPYYDWDDPVYRRNYGEPIDYNMDICDRVGPWEKRPTFIDHRSMLKFWVLLVSGTAVLYYIGEQFQIFSPMAPKQYPEYFPSDNREKNTDGLFKFSWYGRKHLDHYGFMPSANDHHH